MSETAISATGAIETATEVPVAIDETRLDRAVDAADFDSRAALVEEATRRLIADVLDEDGALECPHDDCDRTFATRRKLRGHLGSSEHAVDVPEGDFWCGYCGYGPSSWRGVNGHHGSSNHDGDPIRLEEEPNREDLVAPDAVPDHKNPDLLEDLYAKHDGTISELCRDHDFDVKPSRVRHYLIEFGIHEVTPQGPAEDGDGPLYRDPEWLEERYEDADGNISEMHRRVTADGVDVPYRTLHNNLKEFGIHDPTESPGRQQSGPEPDAGSDKEAEADASESDESEDVVEETVNETVEDKSADVSGEEPADETTEPAETDWVEPDDATAAVDGGQEDDTDDEDSFFGFAVDGPADVEEYADLETPEWSDEDSFYAALDMSDSPEEFSEILGGGDPETLRQVVEALGREDAFTGGRDE